jgi:hypothetical protein
VTPLLCGYPTSAVHMVYTEPLGCGGHTDIHMPHHLHTPAPCPPPLLTKNWPFFCQPLSSFSMATSSPGFQPVRPRWRRASTVAPMGRAQLPSPLLQWWSRACQDAAHCDAVQQLELGLFTCNIVLWYCLATWFQQSWLQTSSRHATVTVTGLQAQPGNSSQRAALPPPSALPGSLTWPGCRSLPCCPAG